MTQRFYKILLYTYGIPDLFFGLVIAMEIYFFPLFLTDYAQFPLFIVSQILWITGLLDIVCTLGGGVILQRTTLKFGGKYRSWFFIGPVIAAPLFIMQFTKIGSDWLASGIIITGFVASHLVFNVFYAAGGVMVGRIARNPEDTTILSASRAQGLSASGIVFSATGLLMIQFFSRHTGAVAGHTLAVVVYAVLMILSFWYLYGMTSGMDPYKDPPAAGAFPKQPYTTGEMVRLIVRNPPLLFLILAEIFRNSYIFIVSGFAVYYFKYVRSNMEFVSVFILAISIASLAGTLAAAWIGVKIGKRNAYWICLVLAGICYGVTWFWTGNTWEFTLMFCAACMFGMAAGSMNTALFTDVGIYGEWKSGRDIRAFIMAIGNLPIKTGILVRSAVFSAGLTAIGFVANVQPSPGVVQGIHSIMTLGPAIACFLAAAAFYFGYGIEDASIAAMQEDIARRSEREVSF